MKDKIQNSTFRIEITPKSILIVALLISLPFIFAKLKDVIIIFFLAFIFASTLSPFIEKLNKKKIPKSISISIIYLLLTTVILSLSVILIKPVVNQFGDFYNEFPSLMSDLLERLSDFVPGIGNKLNKENVVKDIEDYLSVENLLTFEWIRDNYERAFGVVSSFFQFFVLTISFFVFSYYLMAMGDEKSNAILTLLPEEKRKGVFKLIKDIELKMGTWARGQLFLCFVIGLMSYIVLKIAGVEYALPIAVVSGILEIVPGIGPTITWFVAMGVTFGTGGTIPQLMIVGIGFLIIQQLENILIVPRVMGKVVGIHPLVVILSIMVGGRLFGIPGALLAVPVIVIGFIVWEYYLKNSRKGFGQS